MNVANEAQKQDYDTSSTQSYQPRSSNLLTQTRFDLTAERIKSILRKNAMAAARRRAEGARGQNREWRNVDIKPNTNYHTARRICYVFHKRAK